MTCVCALAARNAAFPRARCFLCARGKAALRAASAQTRVISKHVILSILRQLLDLKGIRPPLLDAPKVKLHQGGVRPPLTRSSAVLDQAFKSFELNLKPGDPGVETGSGCRRRHRRRIPGGTDIKSF